MGLTHVALAVAELDRSIEFYATFGEFRVVHRRERHAGQGVAWISDGTRPFVLVLLEGREHSGTLSGWAHLGIGVASRDEVDRRLLRYLMRHPGQLLSKSRLTEHVYDFDAERDSNVLEVYINRLRRKFGHDLIATRRGQGYVFGADNA